MLDRLAQVGLDEGWLYRSREDAVARGILDAGQNPETGAWLLTRRQL